MVGGNPKHEMADALRLAGMRRSFLRAIARLQSQWSLRPRMKRRARTCGGARREARYGYKRHYVGYSS